MKVGGHWGKKTVEGKNEWIESADLSQKEIFPKADLKHMSQHR